MILLCGAAHWIAMPLADPMAHIDEIQMGIDLDDMDRSMLLESPHAGNIHRMIAAQDNRQSTTVRNCPCRC